MSKKISITQPIDNILDSFFESPITPSIPITNIVKPKPIVEPIIPTKNEVTVVKIEEKQVKKTDLSYKHVTFKDIEKEFKDESDWCPLRCCVLLGDILTLKELLSKPRYLGLLNRPGKFGWTVLFYAVVYNHIEIVRYLVSIGAKTNLISKGGYTLVELTRDKEMIKYLKSLK